MKKTPDKKIPTDQTPIDPDAENWETVSKKNGNVDFEKFTHDNIGLVIEGEWLGQEKGNYGQNDMVKTADGRIKKFIHSVGLDDLLDIPIHTIVRITWLGMEVSRNDREYKRFDIKKRRV